MLEDVMIAPSILSADIAHLAADLEAISTADYVHVDVMDGHFVPNLTFGPNVVKAVKACTDVPADVHLMISLEAIIADLDLVLVMSVNPGFGGQKFIPGSLHKVAQVRALANEQGVSPIIEVDGGCSAANAAELVEAGATMLVAGSAVYGKSDRAAAIAEIREAGRAGLAKRA